MKTCTSISGGKTSAYLAANYPTDLNVFSLVCVDDPKCAPKDKKLLQYANDKLEKTGCLQMEGEVIGTAEDPIIFKTIMQLEQFIGKEIDWVRGESFDIVANTRGGWLPNKLHRYCTAWMKVWPIFRWWYMWNGLEPIQMNIGYRANELNRVAKMNARLNENGLLTFDDFGLYQRIKSRYHKRQQVPWQLPTYPLVLDMKFKDQIDFWWQDKPVEFAEANNCVGCFHRNEIFLAYMNQKLPNQFDWFVRTERKEPGNWKDGVTYEKIQKRSPELTLFEEDFSGCDSGYCGM